MSKKQIKAAHYIEELARNTLSSKPYFEDIEKRKTNNFPSKPGVYVILRFTNFEDKDYKTDRLNTKFPIVLYVGKTTSTRSIKERLRDHFSGKSLSYQGS